MKEGLFKDVFPMLQKHYEKINNLELLILKGHIITEHVIDIIIQSECGNRLNIKNQRFNFSDKLAILRILIPNIDHQRTYESLKKFNDIRNKISHTLEFNTKEIDMYISIRFKDYKDLKKTKKNRTQALRATIITVFVQLTAIYTMKFDEVSDN